MQRIHWHMKEDKLINLMKSLLTVPDTWIRTTESSSLELTIEAEAEEVQKEIYRWLKERIKEDRTASKWERCETLHKTEKERQTRSSN